MTKVIAYTALHYGREIRENCGIIEGRISEAARGAEYPARLLTTKGHTFMATSDSTSLVFCTQCGKLYAPTLKNFAAEPKKKNGLTSACRSCLAEAQRQYRRLQPERVRATELKRKDKPERKLSNAANARRRYHDDPKRLIKRQASNANARARRAGAPGKCTVEILETQYRSQKGLCWWCERELNGGFTVDHRVSFSRGGTNQPENIVVACSHCNNSKNKRLPSEWNGRLL